MAMGPLRFAVASRRISVSCESYATKYLTYEQKSIRIMKTIPNGWREEVCKIE